jgi:hypothetical protein
LSENSKPSRPMGWKAIEALSHKKKAEEVRREAFQGKGRPIISTEFNDHRFVAVGNTVHYAKADQTKTFTDFLSRYLKTVLTPVWGNSEIAKPLAERHPLMQWYDQLCRLIGKEGQVGEIRKYPQVGLVHAYYSLAYNLYLLQHNAEVQALLIQRLKDPNSFLSALYETHVASWFILAGFKLSLEDEQDGNSTHVEFVAEAKAGRKYSVEAKCREPNKNNWSIRYQFARAFKKVAKYPRIICIEMSIRQEVIGDQERFLEHMESQIRRREATLKVDGIPAPPAYVFISNIPHHLHLDDDGARRMLFVDGFKIPDIGAREYPSLTEAYKARVKHADVIAVGKAFEKYTVPLTFDGEVPEFAFGQAERRFIVGDHHRLDDGTEGVLEQGFVLENEKAAYLVYATDDGRRAIHSAPLTDAELAAYKQHPETFFGKVQEVGKEVTSTLDMYEFIHESYKNVPREKILEWFAKSPDVKELEQLPIEELRFAYTERTVIGMIHKNPPKDVRFPATSKPAS